MTLEDLIKDPPKIHGHPDKEASIQHLSIDALRFIDTNIRENVRTLETGIGISTALLTMKGCNHTCIAPVEEEVALLRAYCDRRGISVKKTSFIVQPSEFALPRLERIPLQLVLIDGNHAFPVPFIDYYYTMEMLDVGGYLIIDDTHIWTGKVLKEFLLSKKDNWRVVENYFNRTIVLQKQQQALHDRWHGEQSYVMRKSFFSIKRSQLSQLFRLVRTGDMQALKRKILNG